MNACECKACGHKGLPLVKSAKMLPAEIIIGILLLIFTCIGGIIAFFIFYGISQSRAGRYCFKCGSKNLQDISGSSGAGLKNAVYSYIHPLQEKRSPRQQCALELNNWFSQFGEIRDIKNDDVQAILNSYKMQMQDGEQSQVLQHFYKKYLNHCLADKKLEAKEIEDLAHLRGLLMISDALSNSLLDEMKEELYRELVDAAIADAKLEEHELAILKKAREELNLPEKMAKRIESARAEDRLTALAEKKMEDEIFSPQDEEELRRIALSLGVNYDHVIKKRSLRELEKYRLFWQIANGHLPAVKADINLQKDEICHYIDKCDILEIRKRTRRVSYAGPQVRIRLAKGLYYKAGSYSVAAEQSESIEKADDAAVYITNKRLIVKGARKSSTLAFAKILDTELIESEGCLAVHRATGRPLILRTEKDVEIMSKMLEAIMRAAAGR